MLFPPLRASCSTSSRRLGLRVFDGDLLALGFLQVLAVALFLLDPPGHTCMPAEERHELELCTTQDVGTFER